MSTYTDARGVSRPLPVATRDVIVHDDALDIDRQLLAGQPVPPELVEAYEAKVGDTDVNRGEARRDDAPGYADQDVATLQAEADRRGLTVEGTGKDGNVLKADLVTALEANDAA